MFMYISMGLYPLQYYLHSVWLYYMSYARANIYVAVVLVCCMVSMLCGASVTASLGI